MLVTLAANHSNCKIVCFLKIVRSHVYKIRNELDASGEDISSVHKGKRNILSAFTCRKDSADFVQKV